MKIYTRKGDRGETSLFTGQRVPKNNPFIEALGAVDACNSTIGLALSHLPQDPAFSKTREQLAVIQHALFDLGAAFATPRSSADDAKLQKTRFDSEEIRLLEQWMDEMDETLPPLKTFILPGGHPAGAALHLARTECRRSERLAIPLHQNTDLDDNVLVYLNRLSDYFFVAARYLNHLLHCPEIFWEHHKLTQSHDQSKFY